jgi:peptidyl-prolyl cis-trans isomerase D
MMQAMRDNMKVVIWATAIAFLVGFGVLQLGGVLNPPTHAGPAGVIAKINGEPVRYEEFNGMYQNILNQVRQSRAIKEGEDSYIREQAWSDLITSKLVQQEVRRRKITVTPEEIKTMVRVSPPEFVMQAPGFQTNGQFDYRKYLAELDNPNSQVPWVQVEDYVAQTLPQQKLQQEIVATAKISEADVRERFQLINDKMTVRYVYFAADSYVVDTTKIGGADIETYYRSHPEEFTGPPEVSLIVTMIQRRPKDPDFAVARERMMGIREQIVAQPDSFPKYARTYSEAGTAERGGDGTDVLYSQLRPSFAAAIKIVQPGQLTDVIREDRSVHLLRLDKRWNDPKSGQMWVHYHEIAFRVEPGADAIRDARKHVQDLIADARKHGITKAATRAGLPTSQTPFFREGNSKNDVFKRFPEAERWAFKAKVGSISTPIPTENGWYIYEIADRQPAGLRPLTQARIFARERLIYSLQLARASDAAKQAAALMATGVGDVQAAKRFRGVEGIATAVTRSGYLGSLGREPEMVGALFSTPAGTWSRPLTGNNGAAVGYVMERQRPKEEDYKTQAPQLRGALLSTARQEVFQDWMESARKNATIEDFRENYFEV